MRNLLFGTQGVLPDLIATLAWCIPFLVSYWRFNLPAGVFISLTGDKARFRAGV
jgi:hypothetical protein